jgi:drug/metabolite transporter (DMT)-like permease
MKPKQHIIRRIQLIGICTIGLLTFLITKRTIPLGTLDLVLITCCITSLCYQALFYYLRSGKIFIVASLFFLLAPTLMVALQSEAVSAVTLSDVIPLFRIIMIICVGTLIIGALKSNSILNIYNNKEI